MLCRTREASLSNQMPQCHMRTCTRTARTATTKMLLLRHTCTHLCHTPNTSSCGPSPLLQTTGQASRVTVCELNVVTSGDRRPGEDSTHSSQPGTTGPAAVAVGGRGIKAPWGAGCAPRKSCRRKMSPRLLVSPSKQKSEPRSRHSPSLPEARPSETSLTRTQVWREPSPSPREPQMRRAHPSDVWSPAPGHQPARAGPGWASRARCPMCWYDTSEAAGLRQR